MTNGHFLLLLKTKLENSLQLTVKLRKILQEVNRDNSGRNVYKHEKNIKKIEEKVFCLFQ